MEFLLSCFKALKKSKESMIVLIFVMVVAFAPTIPGVEGFVEWRQANSIWITLLGMFAASVLFVNLCCWIKDFFQKHYLAAKAQSSEMENFKALAPEYQKFLLDLYFSGRMSVSVLYESPAVAAMKQGGYIRSCGFVTLDGCGKPCVNVVLTRHATEFFAANREELRAIEERLINDGY